MLSTGKILRTGGGGKTGFTYGGTEQVTQVKGKTFIVTDKVTSKLNFQEAVFNVKDAPGFSGSGQRQSIF